MRSATSKVSPTTTRDCSGSCHLDDDTVVLDRINTWTGTSEHPVQISDVETWLTQASATYHSVTVILDPWQAIGLAQRLKRRRIRVEEYTFSAPSVGRLATTVHLLLREHRLALPQDAQLLDELPPRAATRT